MLSANACYAAVPVEPAPLYIIGNIVPYEAGDRVMTDDRAPVELLSMRVMDQLIGSELSYYRDLYEREGVRGLLANISF